MQGMSGKDNAGGRSSMIYWLRAIVLSVLAGELLSFLSMKYFPIQGINHLSLVLSAFTVAYIMAPRVKDIKIQNNNSFSIHLIDPKTKVISRLETPKEHLKPGDVIYLRDRETGGGYHLHASTPMFVINRPATGDSILGVPYMLTEIYL